MHSYESENGTIFHHNSDFSGDVTIIVAVDSPDRKEIHVSGNDILEFVAFHYIARERIARLEQMSWRELLKTVTG